MRRMVTVGVTADTDAVRAALKAALRKRVQDHEPRYWPDCDLEVDVDPDEVLRDMDVEDMMAHVADRLGDLPERLYIALAHRRTEDALTLARELAQTLTGRVVP